MKVTIKQIAKIAGVSQATVSKIINNYDDVGEATKKRVLDIMDQHGYRPSYSAKTLASNHSNLIGVVYAGKVNADFNHPFFVDVMNSFKKSIGFFGYDLMFFSNEKFNYESEDYLARCRHYQVEGCIIIGGEEIQESIYDLDKSEIPCIGVDIKLTGNRSGYIMTDNSQISAKVVEHFYLQGYRDIAYIGGKVDSEVGTIRYESFKKVVGQYGLQLNEDWIIFGDYFKKSGYEAMKKLLSNKSIPEAVFAASDLMALGAIQAIKEHGLRVPDDIVVIGCDDIEAAGYVEPPLTTIRQDKEKIGKLAAHMLVDFINEKIHSTSVMVEPDLIIRGTCGKAKNIIMTKMVE
ncbi:LacI family DNA-binding transcriptional regulator [Alkalihalobacillus sp. LMS39]|uniref:LacI family DNA-binding transcriptional regulator n=1 Tax=Alkalihalobacillus sp. LMS39 TaxID=2924032 RepID=UPI001FB534AB|nr:LacI family DNA-binding transcriptional regulator [Alkalihalobacillus sp. LMS39]UOE93274.1 LacI family transcriptional regulator [Alkalihalobacillus sp. LMS39]